MRVTCTVNGEPQQADDVWEGESLLYVLRERLGLPGSKNACEQGECGSCTVYLDGVLVCACLVAAGQAQGRDVRTVEGLAAPAASCPPSSRRSSTRARCSAASARPGCWSPRTTCSSGSPTPADAEIREALAGNLCRCTGYEKILDAVRLAAARRSGRRASDLMTAPTTPARDVTRPDHAGIRRRCRRAAPRPAGRHAQGHRASSPTPPTCGWTT